MTSRASLRRQMRSQRRALSNSQASQASTSIARHLAASGLFRRSRRIACYWAVDGEVDLGPVLARAWAMKKSCYLPVLDTLNYDSLWFVPHERRDALILNRFGIPEPDRPCRERIRAPGLDLVLAPLVAYDRDGNRLGMGGGFYDRTLAFLHRRRYWRKPVVVGIAYGFQEVEHLPSQRWDVPMHAVVTDSGLHLT